LTRAVSVIVVTPPTEPAVSYEEAKAHLRLDHDEEQAYVEALVAAAEQHFAAPAGWLGRSICLQTLELRTSGFGWCELQLPYGPVRSIASVKYDDAEGVEQTVDPAGYTLIGAGSDRTFVGLARGHSWPTANGGQEAVRIRYTAGYEPDDVPAPLKQAILLLVSHWYENREAVNVGNIVTAFPFAVEALASPFRVWTV